VTPGSATKGAGVSIVCELLTIGDPDDAEGAS